MEPFDGTRKKLGLTLKEFASLLGVSLDLVSKYELGDRNLTFDADIKLSEIKAFLKTAPTENQLPPAIVTEQLQQVQKVLERDAVDQLLKHRRAQQQAEKTEAKYAQNILLYQLTDYLKVKYNTSAFAGPIENEEGLHAKNIDILGAKALKEIDKNGLPVQAELMLGIPQLDKLAQQRADVQQTILAKAAK